MRAPTPQSGDSSGTSGAESTGPSPRPAPRRRANIITDVLETKALRSEIQASLGVQDVLSMTFRLFHKSRAYHITYHATMLITC